MNYNENIERLSQELEELKRQFDEVREENLANANDQYGNYDVQGAIEEDRLRNEIGEKEAQLESLRERQKEIEELKRQFDEIREENLANADNQNGNYDIQGAVEEDRLRNEIAEKEAQLESLIESQKEIDTNNEETVEENNEKIEETTEEIVNENNEEIERVTNAIERNKKYLESEEDEIVREGYEALISSLERKRDRLTENQNSSTANYTEDNETEIESNNDEINPIQEEINQVEQEIQDSINRFMEIFNEERQVREEDLHTAEELDAIDEKYTAMKLEENQKLEDLRARKKELEEQLNNQIKPQQEEKQDEQSSVYRLSGDELPHSIEESEPSKPIKVTPEQFDNIEKKNQSQKESKPRIVPEETKEDTPRLEGQTKEDIPGLPGPTMEDIPRLPGPTKDDNLGLPGPTEKKEVRTLRTILREITLDKNGETLDLTQTQRKRIGNSKVGITEAMKYNISHGNRIYNVLGTAASPLQAGILSLFKLVNKGYAMFHPKAKQNYETIIQNIDALSDSDLEILDRELTGFKANSLSSYASIIPLVQNRVKEHIDNKKNAPLRIEITNLQIELLDKYQKLRELREQLGKTTDISEQAVIRAEMANLSKGTARQIQQLNEKKNELDINLNGYGKHALEEHSKAIDSHQNRRGKIFGHNISLKEAEEFNEKDAALERKLETAVAYNQDLEALESFGDKELFEYENTKARKTIIGDLESGMTMWKAMPEALDYRSDPLVRYIATVYAEGAIVSGIIANMKNAQAAKEANRMNDHNRHEQDRIDQIDKQNMGANSHNKQTIDDVHATGKKLEGRADDYGRGLHGQGKMDISHRRSTEEYAQEYDPKFNGWDANHRAADLRSHAEADRLSEYLNKQASYLEKQYKTGKISSDQFVREMGDAYSQIHKSSLGDLKTCIGEINAYLATNSNYSYKAVLDSLNTLTNDPKIFDGMIKGMVESVKAGQTLQQASIIPAQQIGAMIQTAPVEYQAIINPIVATVLQTGCAMRLNEMALKEAQAGGQKITEKMEEISNKNREKQQEQKNVNQSELDDMLEENEEEYSTGRTL